MVAVENRRAPRPYVDFASVPVSQWKIHDRLENWARWSHGASGEKARLEVASPMFALYRSTEAKRAYGEETSVPVDKADALRVHFAIIHPTFPPQQRKALKWAYIVKRNPSAAARELGLGDDLAGLRDLVQAGRMTLIDRAT